MDTKQIFDWLREQIESIALRAGWTNDVIVNVHDVGIIINEAEAKWEAEVVSCKDCKHWKDVDTNWCTEHVKLCNIGTYAVGENGYCVYGERKPIKISEVE